MRWRAGCAIVLAAVALAGCSKTVPPLRFGSAQPGSKLTVPAASGDELPGDQWPDACTLVSDAELTAILPQATKITRKQRGLNLMDFSLERNRGDEHIPQAGCDMSMELPAKYDSANTNINLMMLGIAPPDAVRDIYNQDLHQKDSQRVDVGPEFGASDCFERKPSAVDGLAITCLSGQYYFEVRGWADADGLDTVGNRDVAVRTMHDKVLGEVIRTLTAKIT